MTERSPRETQAELKLWTRSDFTLLDDTQDRVRRLLHETIEDMGALEREIAEAPELFQYLEQHLRTDALRINSLRAAISIVKRVPQEILTGIFLYLTTGAVVFPPGIIEYPWTLGHVCARWRNVLWDSHSIWSGIMIEQHRNQYALAESRLSRNNRISESLKYLLSNTHMAFSYSAGDREVSLTWPTIGAYTHRLTNLILTETTEEILVSLLDLPPQSFERLEYLDIRWRTSYLAQTPKITSSLAAAPNLHFVMFASLDMRHTPQLLFLPWEQLTHLHMLCMELSPTTIYFFLHRLPTLLSCGFCIGLDEAVMTDNVITLENLKILNLIAGSILNWDNFIHPLTTPSLKHLTIEGPQIPLQPFQSLVIRSNCALEEVEFNTNDNALDDPSLESFLNNLGAVTAFHMHPCFTAASVVRQIHKGLLPLLESGTFRVHGDGLDAFLDLVDEYIQPNPNRSKGFLSLMVKCADGPGSERAVNRYSARQEIYNRHKSPVHLSVQFTARR
jgi:hypothetical protein